MYIIFSLVSLPFKRLARSVMFNINSRELEKADVHAKTNKYIRFQQGYLVYV